MITAAHNSFNVCVCVCAWKVSIALRKMEKNLNITFKVRKIFPSRVKRNQCWPLVQDPCQTKWHTLHTLFTQPSNQPSPRMFCQSITMSHHVRLCCTQSKHSYSHNKRSVVRKAKKHCLFCFNTMINAVILRTQSGLLHNVALCLCEWFVRCHISGVKICSVDVQSLFVSARHLSLLIAWTWMLHPL